MREHAKEFAQAGFVCLVPDLFWRQEPGVELSDHNPADVTKAFDLYYDFDYDLGVEDMKDTMAYLKTLPECNGHVGAVGYCLGGKLCYLMCCRTDIDCAVAYYGTYIEHRIKATCDEALEMRLQCLLVTAKKLRRMTALGAVLAKPHAGEGPRLHHRAVARDDAVGNHLMPPFSHQAQNALKLPQGKRFWLCKRTTQQAIHGLVQAGHAR
jgi:dienelactone hydrolase